MKKVIVFALIAAMLMGICACGNSGSGDTQPVAPQTLQVGFGRESIVPEIPTHLSGGSDVNRIHETVLDFIYVTCIAITDPAGQTVLIYTQDLQSTVASVTNPVIKEISVETGIAEENILVAATHTHSAPTQTGNWTGVQEHLPIYKEGMKAAAKAALADRTPATIQAGSTKADGYVFTRHYLMMDGTYAGSSYGNLQDALIKQHTYEADTTVQLINFVREGKKNVVMMNLGIHPTFNGSAALLNLSADAPGPIRDHIEQNTDSLVAYFMAPAGDQTAESRYVAVKHGLDYKAYGQKVGQIVVDALPTLKDVTDGNITLKRQDYIANCNKTGMERLLDAKKINELFLEKGYADSNPVAKEAGFASVYEARAIVNRSTLPATMPVQLASMTIGDLSLIFASFEMFGNTGTYIRENSPYENTFIITQAMESNSYIPSDIGFEIGCYESYVTQFEQGTAKKIADTYIDTLKEMKG